MKYYKKNQFGSDNILNLGETGLTNVETLGKVISNKGVKQAGQVASSERNDLVTLYCMINVLKNALPINFK